MSPFIPFDPNRPQILPPDLREALPEGNAALLFAALIGQRDVSQIEAALPDECVGGALALDPRLMVCAWLDAYLAGVRSSTTLAQATGGYADSRAAPSTSRGVAPPRVTSSGIGPKLAKSGSKTGRRRPGPCPPRNAGGANGTAGS